MEPPATGHETIKLRSGHQKNLRLYASWFCPCAQRTWAALEELADKDGVDYEYVPIDPYMKGPNGEETKNPYPLEQKRRRYPSFVEASPRGLVPALDHASVLVNDSQVCCEYLAEAFPENNTLMPASIAERAKVRMFWEHCQSQIIPHFYKMLMHDGEKRLQAMEDFLSGMRTANNMMAKVSSSGFFLGEGRYSLADLSLGPWMQRVPVVLKTYRNFDVPDTEEYARIHSWWRTLRAHPSFARVIVSPESLIKNYSGYADGTATSEYARTYAPKDP